MESPAAAAGPRVYVPITHPDSPVPTYAVLQFLGFSPPPDPKQSPILHTHHHFAPPPSPPVKLLPSSSPSSNPPSPAPKRGSSPTDSSSNSSCDEKDKKFTSIKPSPMKKSSSTHPSALSPGARRNGKGLPLGGATISISRTDKDTIIHTHSSNFREVVHQLTGAASGDKDLLPVSMPPRSIIRSSASNDKDVSPGASPVHVLAQNGGQFNGKQEAFGVSTSLPVTSSKLLETGSIRRPIASTTTKLLERRKSNKVLERLSTSCRSLPPLVPSPVTPLASDFEKICLPGTPSTSEGSSTVVTPAACASTLLNDAIAMEVLSAAKAILSHERKGLPHTDYTKAAEAVSMDAKGMDGVGSLCDAMDVQGPSIPHVTHTHSLSLSDRRDAHVPTSPHTTGARVSSPLDAMDIQGPSLGLATGITDPMDVQRRVVTQEVSLHDAMVTEGECLRNGKGVQDSTSTPLAGRGANRTHEEELAIAKKSFFFHSQRPRHGDPMLLHLFPESPREL